MEALATAIAVILTATSFAVVRIMKANAEQHRADKAAAAEQLRLHMAEHFKEIQEIRKDMQVTRSEMKRLSRSIEGEDPDAP